jgi:hypothetical protein
MSPELALVLTVLTLGSCYASWRLGIARGQQEMLDRFRDYQPRPEEDRE